MWDYLLPAALVYLFIGPRKSAWEIENMDDRVWILRYKGKDENSAEILRYPSDFGLTDHINRSEGLDILPGGQYGEFMIFPAGSSRGIYFNATDGVIVRKISR